MTPVRILSLAVFTATAPFAAIAHPMGNFTINHYSRLSVERRSVRLRFVLDMAELPTLTERQDMDKDANGEVSEAESAAYLEARIPRWLGNLKTSVDGAGVKWALKHAAVKFTPGVANLATMRIEVDAATPIVPGERHIVYHDANYSERPGWKEIVVASGAGVSKPTGDAPDKDLSRELRSYPNDLIASPPDVSGADFTITVSPQPPGPESVANHLPLRAKPTPITKPMPKPAQEAEPYLPWAKMLGTPAVPVRKPAQSAASPKPFKRPAPAAAIAPIPPPATATRAQPTATRSRWSRLFQSLVSGRRLTLGVLLASLITAFLLGALHALQPGHGKTLVAAYLVGQHGTAWHAVLLGITVTISHTFGVFLLGAVALFGSQYILPEVLAPWMAFASGILVALIGASMLLGRLRESHRERAHSHAHSHGLEHVHETHGHHADGAPGAAHSHGPLGTHTHDVPETITLRSLVALGISGGIVPCWDALIVLLGAVAIHQTLYGIALIVSFSAGLATTLTLAGLAVVWGGQRTGFSRLTPERIRVVSIIGNTVVMAIGVAIAVQSLAVAGVLGPRK